VSSTFALMEALILIFLYRRNRHFDRWNALFHLPLVLQEGLQAVLWTHVERERDWAKGWDDEALHVCPKSNTVCTFLVLAVVGAVPAWFARCTQSEQVRQQSVLDGSGAPIWVQLVGPIEKESAEKLRGTLRILTVGQAVALLCMGYLYFVASGVPSQTSWIAMCTCKGPWGHQIWAFMSWPNKPLEGFGFVNAVTIVLYLLMGPEVVPLFEIASHEWLSTGRECVVLGSQHPVRYISCRAVPFRALPCLGGGIPVSIFFFF